MSYADRRPPRGRAATIVSVAALHGAVFYALVTGLGIEYVKETIANLPARSYQPDPPPPPPEPEVKRQDPAKPSEPNVTTADPVFDLPAQGPVLAIPELPDFVPSFDPPVFEPAPEPPRPKPSFTPESATPRNDPASWVSTNDYPTRDIRQGNEGTARFLLTVTAKGRVTDCRITRSSGYPGLDAATCTHVSRRARFEPATDGSGARVAGTYSGSIRWVIPE